jgi:DNA adenine methylase
VVGGTGRRALTRELGNPISRSHDPRIPPLLKWAGGKRQLLPHLRRFYPRAFNRYIEPFFGSGAVFFDLHSAGRLQRRDVILIDSNPDLIGCYETVRDFPEQVARELARLGKNREEDPRAHYFLVRDEHFNPLRDERRQPDGRIAYTPTLAAMLIYLNRTGFNGLFRVNASGAFNVPPGRYERPGFADAVKLRRVADALSSATLMLESYEHARSVARAGDFLYFDPPYAPMTETANFTSYTAAGFGAEDQKRLQALVVELARRGCHVVVSNSSAVEMVALYETNDAARSAGLRTYRVPAKRAINSIASRRGRIDELVVSNVAAH